jgi:hypothetical protein
MLILLNQGTPVPIPSFLKNHTVKTAAEQGWSTLTNSELLKTAEDARFDLLLTTDKNLSYQQDLAGRKIAVVVLGNSQWPVVQHHVHRIVAVVDAAKPGSYTEVNIPHRS